MIKCTYNFSISYDFLLFNILFYKNKILPPPPPPHFFRLFLQSSGTAYRIWNNGQIWTFKQQPSAFYMIRPSPSGANASLVAKIGTKIIILLPLIKSSPVDWFSCLRCLNDCIDLPDMIGLLASGATNCLVAKIGTKDIATSCRVHFNSNAEGLRLPAFELSYLYTYIVARSLVQILATKKFVPPFPSNPIMSGRSMQ